MGENRGVLNGGDPVSEFHRTRDEGAALANELYAKVNIKRIALIGALVGLTLGTVASWQRNTSLITMASK